MVEHEGVNSVGLVFNRVYTFSDVEIANSLRSRARIESSLVSRLFYIS
jgi:hypothetical protein